MKPQTQLHSSQPAAGSGGGALLSPKSFGWLRDLLADYSGVYLDGASQRVLEAGLAQRLQATGDDLASYELRLRSADARDELRLLAELVLNHETFFFRNMPHLRALRETLLHEVHLRKPAGVPIRFWSAGCATGEEAYSLAITALETLGHPLPRPVDIWATDLSEPALRRARAGVYRGRALGNLAPELLPRYFNAHGDGYAVADHVRTLVRFENLNLLDPFPSHAHEIDIIFCQNVTIYFQLDTCRKLIEQFYRCLPEGGMLFLGFSETLWNVFDRFHSQEVAGAYVYYKESEKSAPFARLKALSPRLPPTPADIPGAPDTAQPAEAATKNRPDTPARVSRYDKRSFINQKTHDLALAQIDAAALQRGRTLLECGQPADALDALRQISPQSECAQQALTLTARAHADRGDLDLAVAEIHRALELDTLNQEAYFLLGLIYSRQGQWEPAAHQLERARYLSPESALVLFYLAEAYRNLGQLAPAARTYRNALRRLEEHPPGELLDGVAVGWLRETCRLQLEYLPHIW
jgi:chemotaxis protein methyltransferase CheR